MFSVYIFLISYLSLSLYFSFCYIAESKRLSRIESKSQSVELIKDNKRTSEIYRSFFLFSFLFILMLFSYSFLCFFLSLPFIYIVDLYFPLFPVFLSLSLTLISRLINTYLCETSFHLFNDIVPYRTKSDGSLSEGSQSSKRPKITTGINF